MGVPSMRGHQGRIKLFSNGQEAGIVNILSADINQDTNKTRSFYVGNAQGEGDMSIEGWSGTIDTEVKDDTADALIDAIIQGNLAGIGVNEVTMVVDEFYPDGQVASYVYFGLQMSLSKRIAGLNEKITKRLDFQADGRIRL